MECPRDSVEMAELSEGEERLLFRCAECGGLWLDVADLNRILLHAELPTLEAMGGRACDTTPMDYWHRVGRRERSCR